MNSTGVAAHYEGRYVHYFLLDLDSAFKIGINWIAISIKISKILIPIDLHSHFF